MNGKFIAAMCFAVLIAVSDAESAEQTGQQLFEKRCVACHKLPDPALPPAVGWEQQLEAMGPLARLKKGQKGKVLDYLLSKDKS